MFEAALCVCNDLIFNSTKSTVSKGSIGRAEDDILEDALISVWSP